LQPSSATDARVEAMRADRRIADQVGPFGWGIEVESAAGNIAAVRRFTSSFKEWLEHLARPPRLGHRLQKGSSISYLVAGAGFGVALVAAVAVLGDSWMIAQVRRLPHQLIVMFDEITHFGKSGWLLFPTGFSLLALAAVPALMPQMSARILAPLTVRVGFLFLAISLPGLFTLAIKQLVGRARPYAADGNAYVLNPLTWRSDYASFPSGHTTTAVAAAFAIAAIWPRARHLAWIYAIVIAISRVAVTAHFPSDVMASAIVGVVGAAIVRNYFAARGLAFGVRPDGTVRAFAGPSFRHAKTAATDLWRQWRHKS
jgi:membrane-associated phospholipid phosphatase